MNTTTDALVAFLRARIDEDEDAAQDGHSPGTPARVLREVAAKRRIVDMAVKVMLTHPRSGEGAIVFDNLIALAKVYADHPSFPPEWGQVG